MKKIRLVNGTEYEIYSISDTSDLLTVSMLDADATAMEQAFKDAENLAIIQYYVGTDLMKAYARYTQLTEYDKKMDQLMSVDYATPDDTTESGFAETRNDVLTLHIKRVAQTTSETEDLTTRVEALEEDMSNINSILEESATETETEDSGDETE